MLPFLYHMPPLNTPIAFISLLKDEIHNTPLVQLGQRCLHSRDRGRHSLAHPMFLPSSHLMGVFERTRSFASAAIAPTNIADMLTRKGPPKGGVPALCIECFRNLSIAQRSRKGMYPCHRWLRRFQGPFSWLSALHLQTRHHP